MATLFTWGVTALGASLVFFFKTINRRVLDAMLGFAAGVMIAASFWSLLAPAIEMAEVDACPAWLPAVIGFLLGGVFLWVVDKVLPHLHLGFPTEGSRGHQDQLAAQHSAGAGHHAAQHPRRAGGGGGLRRAGRRASPRASLAGAVALAIGIGLQNFPEGAAVSVPLRREGMSRLKSFWYGQLSGMVEPIAGVLGAAAVLFIRPHPALRAGLRRRRHDLRGGRGTDPRVAAQQGRHPYRHLWRHAGFRGDDAPGCRIRVIQIRSG